jgi:hypothetical protein
MGGLPNRKNTTAYQACPPLIISYLALSPVINHIARRFQLILAISLVRTNRMGRFLVAVTLEILCASPLRVIDWLNSVCSLLVN